MKIYQKASVQGTNYYLEGSDIEKFRYNPYRKFNREVANKSMIAPYKDLPAPLHYIVELSSKCNLKCFMCNRQKMTRPQMNMDFELYKKVIDEAVEVRPHSVSLYCLGEPFLNPRVRDMISYAKKMHLPYVDISTNACYNVNCVLGTGLDEIIISLDGEKEQYEKIRGASYKKAIMNIESLLEKKKKGNYDFPFIRLQIIKFKENQAIFDKFLQKWLPRVEVVYLKNIEGMRANLGDTLISEEEANKKILNRVPCRGLWFTLTVNSNGDIAYCPHDPKGLSVLGNIKNISLKEAWSKVKGIRLQHIQGDYPELCKNCTDFDIW